MLMKWLPLYIIIISCCLIIDHAGHCSETYHIGNNRVLLYKIINWWYDCLPEESNALCGLTVKCRSRDDTQVVYNETEMILRLQIDGGFAGQFSIFKQCEPCLGPSHLKCTWLNKKYFGKGEAAIISNDFQAIRIFTIKNIDKYHGQIIQNLEKDIEFELEGSIGGLLNGRVALHRAGDFIKTCSTPSHGLGDSLPISLKIINSNTKEILATYSAIMEK
ncbi:hypothetical protein [Desulfospira joergensenii]|uniref:hypothetical protein n=1 Tax=Desulfospira joergensenii TaxID=53329 RepID=UPI0004801E96|nr:hypothetical protein [Desulfospira joergensenii]